MINKNDIYVGLFKLLDGDATLESSSYLNGTSKIYLGPDRGEGFVNPTATIVVVTNTKEPDSGLQRSIYYRINFFTDDLQNGVADMERLGNLADRANDLLHKLTPVRSGVTFIQNLILAIDGPVKSDSPSAMGEHFESLQGRLFAIKNT